MFPKLIFTAIFAALPAFLASADVSPSEPEPGTVANAGSNCHIAWKGDQTSTTAWKNMSIELMTGSNYNMVPLTNVASNLDGSSSGSYDWTCPQVNPYSAIYFYQFTAPGASDKQWTTRFTIASPSGQITPPSNATQPGTGEAVPWGTGSLIEPSTNDGSSSPPSSSSSSLSSSSSSPSSSASSSNSSPGTANAATSSTPSGFTTVVVTTGTTPTTTASAGTASNGATTYTRSISSLALSICVLFSMSL